MSQTSLLARIGLRLGTLGSALSLAYAAPIAEGDVSNDAHTHAARTGWYHPTPTSTGFVANAVEQLRIDADVTMGLTGSYAKWYGADRYLEVYTTSAAAGAALYCNNTVTDASQGVGAVLVGQAFSINNIGLVAGTTAQALASLTATAKTITNLAGSTFEVSGILSIGGGGGTGALTNLFGTKSTVAWSSSSASTFTVSKTYGAYVRLSPNGGAGSTVTATDVYGFYQDLDASGIATTITNFYGVYLATPTGTATTITNRWGLYQADTSAKNFFGGIVQLPDGAVGAPSIAFANSATTGIYRSAANELSVAINGTQRFTLNASTANLSLPLTSSTITASPSLAPVAGGALNGTPNWLGNPGAVTVAGVLGKPSIYGPTANSTAAIGLCGLQSNITTNVAYNAARTVTGMAGWYEQGNLGVALGGGTLGLTNYYGGYVANLPALAAGVTVTNQYGLYLEAPTRGSTLNISLYSAGLVHLNAAENHAITRVSGNTTLDATHFSVEVDASGGPVTITLPDSTGAGVNGRIYNVKKVDNSANAVTIARSGADTIDGVTSQSLTAQWQSRTVQARAATPGYAIF